MTLNNKLFRPGDELFIKLSAPYTNVLKIISYQDKLIGESSTNTVSKYYRWSITNVSYSDWERLTDENLQSIKLNSTNNFWIQYKYVLDTIADGEYIEFISISLEIENGSGSISDVISVEFYHDEASCCGNIPNLVISNQCCSDNLFKPYNLDSSVNNYKQLSRLVSDMFGFDVNYYRTDPILNSKDVILKEYSLFNVDCVVGIKVLVPDNQFPSKDYQYNALGIDLPDMFEIHIEKTTFQQAFGEKAIPRQRDYLWFEKIKQMYEVNSVTFGEDEFFYERTYFRVNLTKYEERSNVYKSEEIQDELDELLLSGEELFKDETENEILDVRKPNQYNTLLTNSQDYVRKYINPRVEIKHDTIQNNNFNIISKYYYDCNYVDPNIESVIYRYNSEIKDKVSLVLWFNIEQRLNITSYITITNVIKDIDDLIIITTNINNNYKVGDIVQIKNLDIYDSYYEIESIIDNTEFKIKIDNFIPITNVVNIYSKIRKLDYEYLLLYDTLKIKLTPLSIIIKYKDIYYVYEYNLTMHYNTWIAMILNISEVSDQMSLFLWKINDNINLSDLINIYVNTKKIDNFSNIIFNTNTNLTLISNKIRVTNIRLFKETIEEEEQQLILNQYVIEDTHLTYIVDNANPELRIDKKTNNR